MFQRDIKIPDFSALRIDNSDLGGMCPSCAFSQISWLFITGFEHNTYQIEVEYLSYLMISIISLLARNSKIQVVKSTEILIFHHTFFEFALLFLYYTLTF